MTIKEAKDIFDQVTDVFADEGIDTHEFCRHMNTAMVAVLSNKSFNSFIKQDAAAEPSYALEQQSFDSQHLQPLYKQLNITPVSGIPITFDAIRASFPDDVIRNFLGIIETKKPEIYQLLAIETQDGLPLYFARHNDVATLRRNSFSKPRPEHPHIQLVNNGYSIEPAVPVRVKVYRMPRHVWLGDGADVDPELGDKVMYDVIMRAVVLAGVQIREYDLVNTVGQLSQAQ